MTDEQLIAVESIISVLRRKPGSIILPKESYLAMTIDELDLDSLDRLDMVMELERSFDVVFTTSAVVKCNTIDEILSVVREEELRTTR